MKSENIYISYIDKLLALLKGFSESDRKALEEGTLKIVFEVKGNKNIKEKKQNNKHSDRLTFEKDDVLRSLKSFASREQVKAFLLDSKFTKKELEAIIAALGSISLGKDSIDKLQNRIVEATVGYELRSQAIHNREVKIDSESSESQSRQRDELFDKE